MSVASNRRWVPWALVVLLSIACTLLYWRESLVSSAYSRVHAKESQSAADFVGQPLGTGVNVKVASDGTVRAISEIVRPNDIIVVWSSTCDACQSLVADYLGRANTQDGSVVGDARRLFLLSRTDNESAPRGFPQERFLYLVYPNVNSPFEGKIVPVIWELDAESRLVEPFFGYNVDHMSRILAADIAPSTSLNK